MAIACIAPISVAVVHPDTYLAAGIAALLCATADFAVEMQRDALDPSDVVVTDYVAGVESPPPQAYQSGRKVSRRLVVTDRSGAWHIRRAIDSGVKGYLLDDCTSAELSEAVRCIARGGTYLPTAVAAKLAESLRYEACTARELVVLGWMSEGLSNKEIGTQLGIGEGTVKTHVKAIFEKLCVANRTAAVAEAQRRGMLAQGVRSQGSFPVTA